jgi:hypothetical protein
MGLLAHMSTGVNITTALVINILCRTATDHLLGQGIGGAGTGTGAGAGTGTDTGPGTGGATSGSGTSVDATNASKLRHFVVNVAVLMHL